MAILVTGGAGYIGSHVAYELVDANKDVIVLDNLSTGFAGAVPSSARLVIGDIADEALLRKVHAEHRIDAIIHMAGLVVVPESITDPLGYYLSNTAPSRTLIAFAVAAGIRHFIFSSTAAVYGTPASIPVGEDAPLRPLSPYGTSKMMTELMLADTAKAHDLRYVALRYLMSRAQTRPVAPANRRAARPTSSRLPARPRPAVAMASTFLEWTIRRATAPAFATSST